MLLKTHVEKMSVVATPTIFVKTIDLSRNSYDIHENKGSYAPRSAAPKTLEGSTPEAGVPPAVAHFRQNGPKKDVTKNTIEAGISMKTNKSRARCPKKIGHLCISFGHFCLAEGHFAENCGS
jgi:hypothetical protein